MNANATTAPVTVANLRSLRDKPFELLRELERLARVALAGQGRDAANEHEWVGIAFRVGSENFLVARDETREVLGFPSVVTRVPGAKPWIRGLANVRGQLLPLVDLRAFLGGGVTNIGRSSRVLVAHHREVPAGLLVDEVQGFRRFVDNEFGTTVPPTIIRCERYIAGTFRRGAESWPVFSLRSLLESPEFLQAAAS
jgi:twitching motility protein PilI